MMTVLVLVVGDGGALKVWHCGRPKPSCGKKPLPDGESTFISPSWCQSFFSSSSSSSSSSSFFLGSFTARGCPPRPPFTFPIRFEFAYRSAKVCVGPTFRRITCRSIRFTCIYCSSLSTSPPFPLFYSARTKPMVGCRHITESLSEWSLSISLMREGTTPCFQEEQLVIFFPFFFGLKCWSPNPCRALCNWTIRSLSGLVQPPNWTKENFIMIITVRWQPKKERKRLSWSSLAPLCFDILNSSGLYMTCVSPFPLPSPSMCVSAEFRFHSNKFENSRISYARMNVTKAIIIFEIIGEWRKTLRLLKSTQQNKRKKKTKAIPQKEVKWTFIFCNPIISSSILFEAVLWFRLYHVVFFI